ncbi:hypothetical protein B0919_12575 [Hymenobacter sp. CRA2]|nr:hypothetical protein B0919_12575 [Hymenobacter sp. CRA2]
MEVALTQLPWATFCKNHIRNAQLDFTRRCQPAIPAAAGSLGRQLAYTLPTILALLCLPA